MKPAHRLLAPVAGLAMILGIAACSGGGNDGEIFGTWTLEAVVVDGVQLDVEGVSTRTFAGVPAWVEMNSAGGLVGEGSCNDFHGGYSYEGETLRPIGVIASAAACEPWPGRDIEEALLLLLWGDVVQVAFDGDSIMSWATQETTAIFIRQG